MASTETQSNHFTDPDGNPAGGATYGVGFAIAWQTGPLVDGDVRQEPNGAFVEEIINAAIDRLEYYQSTKFACRNNQEAIQHLQLAVVALNFRTLDRESRGVEGTHQV